MREIFTNKGYKTGASYNRNGLQYRVVEEGRPTWISVTEGDVTTNYQETSPENSPTVIHRIDEDTYLPEEAPLPAEEVTELRNTILERVTREATELGLAEPETVDELIGICLTCWKKRETEVGDGEPSQEEIDEQYIELMTNFTRREIIEFTSTSMMETLLSADSARTISIDQQNYVFNWMINKDVRNQIVTPENIVTKYNQIRNIDDGERLAITNIGLTYDQAEEMSPHQALHLIDFYQEGAVDPMGAEREVTPNEMQAKYATIRNLREDYQLYSLDLGLTIEQAEAISGAQYDYLAKIYPALDPDDATPQHMQDHFEEIRDLTEAHQIDDFLNELRGVEESEYEYESESEIESLIEEDEIETEEELPNPTLITGAVAAMSLEEVNEPSVESEEEEQDGPRNKKAKTSHDHNSGR